MSRWQVGFWYHQHHDMTMAGADVLSNAKTKPICHACPLPEDIEAPFLKVVEPFVIQEFRVIPRKLFSHFICSVKQPYSPVLV